MRSTAVLLVLFIFILVSCNEHRSENPSSENVTVKSNSCDITNLVVPEVVSDGRNAVLIREPVAITFFNLFDLIMKYDGRGAHYMDSLPEKLRSPHRQEIYKTMDIAGMYGAFVVPAMDSLSIKIIDTVQTSGFIAFNVNGKRYVIDKSLYHEKDGVLFYNGKDKPVFWTEGLSCQPDEVIKEYYRKK